MVAVIIAVYLQKDTGIAVTGFGNGRYGRESGKISAVAYRSVSGSDSRCYGKCGIDGYISGYSLKRVGYPAGIAGDGIRTAYSTYGTSVKGNIGAGLGDDIEFGIKRIASDFVDEPDFVNFFRQETAQWRDKVHSSCGVHRAAGGSCKKLIDIDVTGSGNTHIIVSVSLVDVIGSLYHIILSYI